MISKHWNLHEPTLLSKLFTLMPTAFIINMTAQAVRCSCVTMEILAQFQTIPCWIWGGQSTSIFSCWSVRFHQCSVLIHLSPMLHNLCNWQYPPITPSKTVWQWQFSPSWFLRSRTENECHRYNISDTLRIWRQYHVTLW